MGVKLKADYVKKQLRKIVNNMQDLSPVMKYIGNDMLNETIDNFDKEQSYDGVKWKKSKRALKESGKTLQKTGRLKNSIKYKSSAKRAIVGTNVIYAKTMQEGFDDTPKEKRVTIKAHKRKIYKKTKSGRKSKKGTRVAVKAHKRRVRVPWGVIPAYRYMGITKKQEEKYTEKVKNHILNGG